MNDADVTLYLIRHGRTALNAAGMLRGRLDPALDAIGMGEAKALGNLFAGVALVAVVTSPLERARQTASAIAATTEAPVEVDEGLADRDYGPWAGTPGDEVERRFGSLDAAPGIEAPGPFVARVTVATMATASRWTPGPLAVVAHDAVNRAVLASLDAGLVPRGASLRTGSWNRLDRRHGRWSASVVDAVPHDGHRP